MRGNFKNVLLLTVFDIKGMVQTTASSKVFDGLDPVKVARDMFSSEVRFASKGDRIFIGLINAEKGFEKLYDEVKS